MSRVTILAWRAARGHLLALVAVVATAAAMPVVSALSLKSALDALAGGGNVLGPIVGVGLAGLASWVSAPIRTYVLLELDRRVSMVACDRLYRAVGGQPGLGRLEDPEYLNRLSIAEGSGARAPAEIIGGLADLVQALLLAAGFVAALTSINPVLSVVVLVSAAPAMVARLALSRRRIRLLEQTAGAGRRELFFGSLLTDIQAALEIRLYGLADFFRGRMLGERRAADRQRRAVDRRDLAVQVSLGALASIIGGAGLLWAASRGGLMVGDIALMVAAIASVQTALSGCVTAAAGLHTELGSYQHFRHIVEPGEAVPVGAAPCPKLRHAISFHDVWFRYTEDGPWVLRGVDLRITAGEAVGVVGANGAGKSTLIKLLCRMYEPTRGTIEWDGLDLRTFDVATLRQRLGAVFQDFVAYDLTAAENIGLGDLPRLGDRRRIREAAWQAGVGEKIEQLSHGYDTMLSRLFHEDGTYLSGGQWQRIAVARALMRADADVMVLDEPSSGLDPDAEAQLNAKLRSLRHGRTSILVSHRLSALRDADTIVVLDGGRVAEQGRHADLESADGRYARLFRTQAAGYLPA